MSDSIYRAIAKLRWPGNQTTIAGDGPLAVELCNRVELVQTPLQAVVLKGERCGAICNHVITPQGGWHTTHELEIPRRTTVARLPGSWEQ